MLNKDNGLIRKDNGLMHIAKEVITADLVEKVPEIIGETYKLVNTPELAVINTVDRTIQSAFTLWQSIEQGKTEKEKQETKRREIDANLEKALATIESERQQLLKFLSERFDERKKLIDQFGKLMDFAIQTDNQELLRRATDMLEFFSKNTVKKEV